MPKHVLKAIFFDAGNTLFEPRESIGETYRRFAEKYGVKITKNVLDEKFNAAFKQAPPMAFPGRSGTRLLQAEWQWWRQVVLHVFEGIDFPRFEAFFEALYLYFAEGDAWQLYPETKAVLEGLRKSGYLLGIISNFDSRLLSICAALGIQDDFSRILFSSRAGMAKPAPEIFEAALASLGVDACESIHVGDSLLQDVEGARKAGMKAIWLSRSGAAPQDLQDQGVITIRDLSGIFQHT